MNVESEGMLWIGVSASWPTLDPRAVSEFLLYQPRCTSFARSSPSPSSLRRLSIFVIGAFRRFCSVFLPWPLSAIHGSSEVTFLIIIPTDRSLTRTQPSSCALVTYGSLVTNPRAIWSTIQPLERASCRSYELVREPLAWGTRRKSIILNHGVIGSNDQTTTRRTRFTPRRFARTCHVAICLCQEGKILLSRLRFHIFQDIINKLTIIN